MLTLLPSTLLAVVLGAYFTWMQLSEMRHQLDERGQLIAEQLAPLAAPAMNLGYDKRLQRILTQVLDQADVRAVTILDPDGYPMRHFTTQNSPLVWDHVQAFAFHPESGDAFIGTTNGISQVTTPYTAPKSDLSEVEVYPNPFILRGEGG